MKEEEIKQANEILDDFVKYQKKINAMMIASVEGPCPQFLKALLFKEMADRWISELEKVNPKKRIEEGKAIFKDLQKNSSIQVKTWKVSRE